MGVMLAIEPDAGQAEALRDVLRGRFGGDLVVVKSKDAAVAAIAREVPDLVLVSALLSPRDEDELIAHLRSIQDASHLQPLTIPQLRTGKTKSAKAPRFGFGRRRGASPAPGCDPTMFAEQVADYLARARELRRQAPPADAPRATAAAAAPDPGAFDAWAVEKRIQEPPGIDMPDPEAPTPEQELERLIEGLGVQRVPISIEAVDDVDPDAPPLREIARDDSVADTPRPLEISGPAPLDLAQELERLQVETTARREAEIAQWQADVEALRDATVRRAREEAEREAREALGVELARARETLAAELAQAREDAEGARRAEVEAGRAFAEELARVRADAEAAAAAALQEEVARVRGEAQARFETELDRLRREAERTRVEERCEAHVEAEKIREAAAREARAVAEAAAGRTLEAEIARVRAEADARLSAELAELRAEAERRRTAELEEMRREVAAMRDAAALQARAAAEAAATEAARQARVAAEAAALERSRLTRVAPVTAVRLATPPTPQPALELQPIAAATSASRAASYYDLWREEAATAAATAVAIPARVRLGVERHRWVLPAAATVLLLVGGGLAADTTAWRATARKALAAIPASRASEPEGAPAPPPPPTVGALLVETTPAGARVLVDGTPRGVSPLTIEGLQPGTHRLVLESPAGVLRRDVVVRAGERAVASEAIMPGWVSIYSRIPLEVWVEGRRLGTSDQGQLQLPPGRHRLTLRNDHFNYRDTKIVDIRPGATTARSITLPTARVVVDAPEGSEVWVEGERVGVGPIQEVPVPIGTREIVVKHGEFIERRAAVEVRHGSVNRVGASVGVPLPVRGATPQLLPLSRPKVKPR